MILSVRKTMVELMTRAFFSSLRVHLLHLILLVVIPASGPILHISEQRLPINNWPPLHV